MRQEGLYGLTSTKALSGSYARRSVSRCLTWLTQGLDACADAGVLTAYFLLFERKGQTHDFCALSSCKVAVLDLLPHAYVRIGASA